MKYRSYGSKTLLMITLVLLGLGRGDSFAVKESSADNPATGQGAATDDSSLQSYSLKVVSQAMIRGDFELARQYINKLDSSSVDDPNAKPLYGLMNRYDQLMSQLLKARKDAYQEHFEKIREKVERAQWRESLLKASVARDFKAQEKEELENELREKMRDNWLEALAQLGATHYLSKRMDLVDKVDPAVQAEIIAHGLEIAKQFESQDEGLKAYSKVYYLLTLLDKQKYQYDELHRRLLRQATLRAIYVPDPNTEGVSWQERRQGITAGIIHMALYAVSKGYVEEADFQAMAERALENCLLVTEMKELSGYFEQFNNKDAVKIYRSNLELLKEKIKEMDKEQFGYLHLRLILNSVIEVNQQSIKLPDNMVMADFAEGAFSALDNYTYIVWPADVADFRKSMTNEFTGVGIVINKDKEGVLKVDSLVSYGAAAYQAGLDAGDSILAIDGKDTKNITLEKAVHLITGPSGTKVVLTINREGFDKPRDFTVNRQHVVVPTVKGLYRGRDGNWQYFLDPNNDIAYARLTHFSGETTGRLRRTLERLKDQGMQALILDLRGNSGGYLSGAVSVVDTFISSGRIVSTRYRNPRQEDVKMAHEKDTFDATLPLSVLINSASASASEIVAGAMKDNQRALIIGTRSFGKGNVQTIQNLEPSEAQLKMTIAYYYLPSGRRVHHDPKDKSDEDYGVEPNIKMELTGKQIGNFIKTQHDSGVLHRNDLSEQRRAWKLYTAADMLASDPQLQMALLSLRARLWAESPAPAPAQHQESNAMAIE